MFDIQNVIQSTESDKPEFFYSDEDFAALPREHKDQLKCFTTPASKWLRNLVDEIGLVNGRYTDTPLSISGYNKVDIFTFPGYDAESVLKKWLYNRGIQFSNKVFLIDYYEERDYYMTWKMLIKYSDLIFYGSDKVVFDASLQWCLVQFANDTLHFGRK